MDYYKEIKNKILDNEAYERVKDYFKERHRVLTYFEIGKLLYEAGKHYGEGIINKYAELLEKDFGKKYDGRTLRRMRQFYLLFNEQKWAPLKTNSSNILNNKGIIDRKWAPLRNMPQKIVPLGIFAPSIPSTITKLTWTHYRDLITIKNYDERTYYTNIAVANNLSVRELRNRIKSKEYERLDKNTREKLITKQELTIIDYVPNPVLIRNVDDIKVVSEKILHNLIMEDIASFMKELGEGYSFIDSEYKIKIDDRHNYIDLLLYNLKFRCYVVIELKVTEFRSEYIGQILKYMKYVDTNIKTVEDDNTIGIIICKRNNQFYLEYCSDERIISREYKLI